MASASLMSSKIVGAGLGEDPKNIMKTVTGPWWCEGGGSPVDNTFPHDTAMSPLTANELTYNRCRNEPPHKFSRHAAGASESLHTAAPS